MFRKYVSREIDQWVQSGLLQADQGKLLMADHDRRHAGFSLSRVLAVLAAVLLGAAVVALVAANWEAFARPLRVAMIFCLIVAGLSGAALAAQRGARWISEAALVFAILCFGAGIALVGQMYHLSGDEAAFMLSWTIGTLVVAISYSSPATAAGAGVLAIGYLFAESGFISSGSPDLINVPGYVSVFVAGLVTGFSAWRSRSRLAGHLTALLYIGWIIWILLEVTDQNPGYALAAIGAVLFALGSLISSGPWGQVSRHGVVSAYGAVLLLSGLVLVQAELDDFGLAGEIVLAGAILAVSVAILAIAGGENRLIRIASYFAFACETVYIVGETLGSLLNSASFLAVGGLVLAVMAFVMMKIERRFKKHGSQS